MTKKQKEMIKEAIYRVNNSLCDRREWDDLFEDNKNNTNAVIIGLINEIERSQDFAQKVEKLEDYMPQEVLQYAKYKNIVSGVSVPDYEPLESFLNQIDDINRFKKEVTPDLWDPLKQVLHNPVKPITKKLRRFCNRGLRLKITNFNNSGAKAI